MRRQGLAFQLNILFVIDLTSVIPRNYIYRGKNNNANDNIYGAVIMARAMREFIRFIL